MVKNIRFTRALALALALAAGALGLAAAPGPAHAMASAYMDRVTVNAYSAICPYCKQMSTVDGIELDNASRDGLTIFFSGLAYGCCPFCGSAIYYGHFEQTVNLSVSSCEEYASGRLVCGEHSIDIRYQADPVYHQKDVFPESAPTCTEAGHEAYRLCSSCGGYFDMAGASIPGPVRRDPLGHDIVKDDGRAATCTEDGVKSHWECKRCKGLFLSEDCAVPVEPADLTVPAQGHTVVNGTCTVCGETGLSQNGSAGPEGEGGGSGSMEPGATDPEEKDPAAGDPAAKEPAASDPEAKDAESEKDEKDAKDKAVARTGDAAGTAAAAAAFAAAAALAAARFSSKRRAS